MSSVGLVDFHCHLDLYPDHAAAVADCEHAGVFTLAVTTTPKAWPRNQELACKTKYVRAALGLHPQLVAERAHELKLWEKLLPATRYVGEVGIDAGPRFYRSIEAQTRVFERVLRTCADVGGKILTVHSVRASKLVLDMIESNFPPARGHVVLHWFTGSKSEARRAQALGCYFSINGQMLKNGHHRAMVNELPLDRILTETDGPFTRIDERPAAPRDVKSTVEELGRVRGMEPNQVAAAIMANLKRLLSEPPAST